jgi:hypothetical protein
MQAWDSSVYPKKKPWDTPYGAVPTGVRGGSVERYVSQFPPKKFCFLAERETLPEDFVSVKATIEPWMKSNKVKGRYEGLVQGDNGIRWHGFSFKRTSDTVRFKLTWG